MDPNTSQGSVATYARCHGILNHHRTIQIYRESSNERILKIG